METCNSLIILWTPYLGMKPNVGELWDINYWGLIVDNSKLMSMCDKICHTGLGPGMELTNYTETQEVLTSGIVYLVSQFTWWRKFIHIILTGEVLISPLGEISLSSIASVKFCPLQILQTFYMLFTCNIIYKLVTLLYIGKYSVFTATRILNTKNSFH